jgi:hypothetical protein
MPTLDGQLRDAAPRMLRKNWTDEGDTKRLAQELYDILKNVKTETTGSVEISNGDTAFVAAPLESLDLPFLDFDAVTREEALGELAARQPNDTQTERYRYFTRRTMLVGIIFSQQSAGTYTVDIYPNGLDDSAPVAYTNVREVQGRTLDTGTAILVNRSDTIEAAELRLDNGAIKGTRIKLIKREHAFSAYDLFSYFDDVTWSAGLAFWGFTPIDLNPGISD